MLFVRVSRDKRGYEHISLMHASGRRGKPAKPRVLYVFRTPPGVKVGREPFDDAVKRALEAQNPGVVFDWKKLSNIPVPAPDVEYWRERRRVDRATKQARRAEEQESTSAEAGGPGEPPSDADLDVTSELEEPADQSTSNSDSFVDRAVDPADGVELVVLEGLESHDPEVPSVGLPQAQRTQSVSTEGRPAGHRRRRRRGGRRHRGHRPDVIAVTEAPSSTGLTGSTGTVAESSAAADEAPEPSKLPGDTSKEA